MENNNAKNPDMIHSSFDFSSSNFSKLSNFYDFMKYKEEYNKDKVNIDTR